MNGFFLTTTEFTEIGVFLNQELFSLRPEPALSNVEERLRGILRILRGFREIHGENVCYRAASMINNTRRICVGGENF